jgi:hypothetical protein
MGGALIVNVPIYYGCPCWAHLLQKWEEYKQTERRFERHTVDLSIKVEEFVAEGQFLRHWYSDTQVTISLAIQLVGADKATSANDTSSVQCCPVLDRRSQNESHHSLILSTQVCTGLHSIGGKLCSSPQCPTVLHRPCCTEGRSLILSRKVCTALGVISIGLHSVPQRPIGWLNMALLGARLNSIQVHMHAT